MNNPGYSAKGMFQYRSAREQLALYAIGGAVLVAIGYVGTNRLRQPAPLTLQTVTTEKTQSREPESTATGPTKLAPAEIVVDVAGAVKHPGIHRLQSGARVDDAVRAAGGPSATGDLDPVNLAQKLNDGDMVRVPVRGQASTQFVGVRSAGDVASPSTGTRKRSRRSKTPDSPININTASAEELQGLPGIGKTTAEHIVEYRQTHGPFVSVEALAAAAPRLGKKIADLLPYVKL